MIGAKGVAKAFRKSVAVVAATDRYIQPVHATTKVQQITDAIVSDIASGKLRSGDRVMPERKMAEQFGVSVGTVQRVLSALANRRIVDRQHGSGTFVRGLGASVDARYLRFRDANDKELPVRWRVLDHVAARPTGGIGRFFGRDTSLVRIDRSVDVGGCFTLLSQFFMRQRDFEALFRGEEPRDDANLRALISERLSLPTLRVQQHVGFEPMPAAVARALSTQAGQPCFAMELRGFTVKDQPIFLQRVYGEPFSRATLVVDTAS